MTAKEPLEERAKTLWAMYGRPGTMDDFVKDATAAFRDEQAALLKRVRHILGHCYCEPFFDCPFWDISAKLIEENGGKRREDECHDTEFHKQQFAAIKAEVEGKGE